MKVMYCFFFGLFFVCIHQKSLHFIFKNMQFCLKISISYSRIGLQEPLIFGIVYFSGELVIRLRLNFFLKKVHQKNLRCKFIVK